MQQLIDYGLGDNNPTEELGKKIDFTDQHEVAER